MKRARPTWDELDVWIQKQKQILSDEDKATVDEVIKHAQQFGMSWEVMWWAFQRRLDEDFNLKSCLFEGLREWDL